MESCEGDYIMEARIHCYKSHLGERHNKLTRRKQKRQNKEAVFGYDPHNVDLFVYISEGQTCVDYSEDKHGTNSVVSNEDKHDKFDEGQTCYDPSYEDKNEDKHDKSDEGQTCDDHSYEDKNVIVSGDSSYEGQTCGYHSEDKHGTDSRVSNEDKPGTDDKSDESQTCGDYSDDKHGTDFGVYNEDKHYNYKPEEGQTYSEDKHGTDKNGTDMGFSSYEGQYDYKHGTSAGKTGGVEDKPKKASYREYRYRNTSPPSNNVRHSERMESSYNMRSHLQRNISRAKLFLDSDDEDSNTGDNEFIYLNQFSVTCCMMVMTIYMIFCNMIGAGIYPLFQMI